MAGSAMSRMLLLTIAISMPSVVLESTTHLYHLPCGRGSLTVLDDAPISAERHLTGPNELRGVGPSDASVAPVRLRFLVATNGRVARGTLDVTGTSDERWTIDARRWLLHTRFVPKKRDGCAVPQWMTLTYHYAPAEPQSR